MRRGALAGDGTQPTSDRPDKPAALLVGFDSAWTATNRGAIVGVILNHDGTFRELGVPRVANFTDAAQSISEWQRCEKPARTIVLLDQPTIVINELGQRPVENLVSSPVCLRYGGVQPANTSKADMFGPEAGVWALLKQFGGAADPLGPIAASQVFEAYPALSLIALGWVLPDGRATGRLPKYNPERETFSIEDWRYVCERLSNELIGRRLSVLGSWLCEMKAKGFPRKDDQDCLDACICLLVALHLIESRQCLMVGDTETGYIVVPSGDGLRMELEDRCKKLERDPLSFARVFTLNAMNRDA